MDDTGHRDNNGRHKPPQGQWLMQHQPSMKQIMAIMAERDAAIQERNLALSEKKSALAERDMAILQRESAINDRNNAIMERDNAIATLHYRENPNNANSIALAKHMQQQQQQHIQNMHHHHNNIAESSSYDVIPMSPVAPEPAKPKRTIKRQPREPKPVTNKKPAKPAKKIKREGDEIKKWDSSGLKDLGLNLVSFDETTMSVPVCSCTGNLRPCYKWGNGGWQSSCCTTTLSMYPLPAVPNKRHARVGGRKMSGSAFTKLISRLAGEGYDLSRPVDLKEHWAKHGTNRYITIK
jgi:hypothetical protein